MLFANLSEAAQEEEGFWAALASSCPLYTLLSGRLGKQTSKYLASETGVQMEMALKIHGPEADNRGRHVAIELNVKSRALWHSDGDRKWGKKEGNCQRCGTW